MEIAVFLSAKLSAPNGQRNFSTPERPRFYAEEIQSLGPI
jgi:hypothetical protein